MTHARRPARPVTSAGNAAGDGLVRCAERTLLERARPLTARSRHWHRDPLEKALFRRQSLLRAHRPLAVRCSRHPASSRHADGWMDGCPPLSRTRAWPRLTSSSGSLGGCAPCYRRRRTASSCGTCKRRRRWADHAASRAVVPGQMWEGGAQSRCRCGASHGCVCTCDVRRDMQWGAACAPRCGTWHAT